MTAELVGAPQLLAGGLGRAVVDAWRPLSAHGGSCLVCAPVVADLAAVPDDPYPLYDRCCPDGKPLFTTWTEAKWALIVHLKEQTEPWGMAGLKGPDAELRARALTALPARAALDIFETPDLERREAKIRAVIAAYESTGSVTVPTGERECAWEECQLGPHGSRGLFRPPPRAPYKRFCSDACRVAAHDTRDRGGDR